MKFQVNGSTFDLSENELLERDVGRGSAGLRRTESDDVRPGTVLYTQTLVVQTAKIQITATSHLEAIAGTFMKVRFPASLPQRRELEHAAGCFGSIEINGSFYSLQSPKSWQAWRDATPEGFVFAVKGPRYLTHMLRLRGFETPLSNFLASGLLKLGDRLGPILWQLPPNFAFDAGRLEAFLGALPRDTGEALKLARRRDVALMRGRSAGSPSAA